MLLRDTITGAAAVATYFAYYAFTSLANQRWAYYVMSGALMAWVGWCLRSEGLRQGRLVLAFAGTLMLIEGMQQAGCGALRWQSTTGQDLCVQVLGESVYVGLASLLLAAAWTWRANIWPIRHQ